jgi:hypothetical protein
MRNYLNDLIEWMAQRIIVRATGRAIEMIEERLANDAPKQLPAPRLPEIEYH